MDLRIRSFPGTRSLFLVAVLLAHASGSSAALIDIRTAVDVSEIATGDVVAVELVVSDFKPEPIAAFDLSLRFDDNVLQFESGAFGDFLGFGDLAETVESIDAGITPGEVAILSISLLFDDELIALQPATFTLASLEFLAIGPGASGFALDTSAPFSGLVGAFGTELTPVFGAAPDIVVSAPPVAVAEPHALGLLAIGAMAWLGRAGRRRPGRLVSAS